MSTLVIVLFFAIIAGCRVIQGFTGKKSSMLVKGTQNVFAYNAFRGLISTAFALLYVVILNDYSGFDNAPTVLYALGTSVFLAMTTIISLIILKSVPVTLSELFASGGVFLPCILGIFVFDEPVEYYQWIGLGLFLAAVFCLVYDGKAKEKKKRITPTILLLLVCSAIANGMVMYFQKCFAKYVENGNTAVYSFYMFLFNGVLSVLCVAALLAYDKFKEKGTELPAALEGEEKPKKEGLLSRTLVICGVLAALAVFFVNLLVTMMAKEISSVILFPVSITISMVICILVDVFAFKEKFNAMKIVGLVVGFAAMLLLNL